MQKLTLLRPECLGSLALSLFLASCSTPAAVTKVASAPMSVAASGDRIENWPKAVQDVLVASSGDGTLQPAIFYASPSKTPRPLLVALHSWSGNYLQKNGVAYADWCIAKDWIFIHPDFRGMNNRPQAVGSELVVADILSAVAYAKQHAAVDESRVYLVGFSGGAYAALLMTGRAANVWTAVSAWGPIVDIPAWYGESIERKQKYAGEIEAAVGGAPLPGTPAEAEAKKRSAITYLAAGRGRPVSINAGIHDGHNRLSVPISHALRGFNELADAPAKLTDQQIAYFVEKESVPPELAAEAVDDPAHADKKVLFRRQSNGVVVTIFSGGHEIITDAALGWLATHHR